MADLTDYVSYFQFLAEKHKEIRHSGTEKHFFLMDINELLLAANSTARYPAMVLLKLSGNVIDRREDNELCSINGGFVILDHCKVIDDFAAQLLIFQKTFRIGMEILSRIRHDQYQEAPIIVGLEKEVFPPIFDLDSVRWEMIGPVFENHFGIIFRLPVSLIAEMEYDASKWQ